MAMGTLHKKLMYYYYLKINISTGKKIIWGKTNVTFIQNYSKSYFLKSKNNPYNWIPSLKTYTPSFLHLDKLYQPVCIYFNF